MLKLYSALILATCVAAQTASYTAAVYKAIAADNLSSVSAAVIVNGRTRHLIAKGLANQWAGVKASPETIYPFGSITQTFTATTVAALAGSHRLDLDEPIEKYLGGIRVHSPQGSPPVTVRHVLAHASGLVDAREPLEMHTGHIAAQPPLMVFYNTLFATHPAGASSRYSATGYGILGLLLTNLAGQSVPEMFRDKWLAPLAMNSTGFNLKGSLQERLAMGYTRPAEGSPAPMQLFYHSPSSPLLAADGLAGTAEDLATWLALHLNRGQTPQGEFVKPEVIEEMRKRRFPIRKVRGEGGPQSLFNSETDGGGLGWIVWRCGDAECIAQSGQMPGYAAVVLGHPKLKTGVVVLTNSDRAVEPALSLAKDLLAIATEYSARAVSQP